MKRTLKQFLAAAMAGVMTLGMVVTASAETYNTGVMNGVGASQGPAPAGTIDVLVPTITVGGSAGGYNYAGDLDLVIDAHGLLKATEGARYQNSDKSVTFDDGNIFFKSMIPATKAKEVTVTISSGEDAGTYTAMLYKKVTVDKTKTGYISTHGVKDGAGTGDAIVDTAGNSLTGNGGDFAAYASNLPATVESASTTATATVVKTGKKAMVKFSYTPSGGSATSGEWAMEAVNPATVDFAYLYVNKTESTKSRVWSDAAGTPHTTLTTATVEALEKAGYVAVPVADEVATYTKDSRKLEFINKSPAAVTVAVTAVLTKGAGNKFELVDAASDLANEDEDGKVNGAQMYLALVNATDADNEVVNVIQDPATEIGDDNNPHVIPGDIRTYNAYTTDTTGNNPTVGSLTMLQGDPTFEWSATADRAAKEAFNTAIQAGGTSGISLAYSKGTDTITASLANLTGYTIAMLPEDEPTAESFVGNSIARKAVAIISRGDEEIARVTFVIDGKSIKAVNDDISATQVVKFDKWVESSQASTISSVPCNIKANKTIWDNTNNEYTFISNELVTNDKFSKAVFYLTGAINTVDTWDLVKDKDASNNTLLKLDLIWDIGEYIEGLSPAIPAATDPTATVATKAEAATSNFTVKYTLGTGDKMFDNLATLIYTITTNGTSKEAKLDPTSIADGVATFKCSQNVFNGSDWKIRFTNDDDDKTFDVPVTIKD